MKKIKKIFTLIILFIFIYYLFSYKYILEKSVYDAFSLWHTKVFPSLFIMFILSDIIINFNLIDPLTKYFNPLFNKIFNLNNKSGNAFILSIISGTPTSGYIISKMVKDKKISLNDANKLIYFTYFSNPLFLYNILRLSFNNYITLKIIIIHYLTNIIIGIIIRFKKSNNITINNDNINKTFFKELPNSIKMSFNNLLNILGTITFYMIITNILFKIIKVNNLCNIIIKGFLEITQSLNMLPSINIISITKEIIALSIISFGGLSIHTQVLSILNDSKILYKNFLIGRIMHVLLSTLTYIILWII